MALFDLFSSKSSNQTTYQVTNTTDSYNRTSSSSNVLDNVGNVSLSFGQPSPESTLDKIVPFIGLAFILLAMGRK